MDAEPYLTLKQSVRIGQPSPPVSKAFGNDCAPALRHGAIIFRTGTDGGCNQHGMGEGIVG
jgi:hypothetical protein